ncbi:hypothetical protein C4D60_Mb04t10430 [Musa balbisiana]|uniref:CSC1/OSCA1-like 7TM region domain-containing protein n=1 Tax=Musa balbisiana TaxID=52838 RepID=A0A4S8KB12_MUSBA|nr:hypothetical protein C4D60_Mb04t10430 [Musa balbisiana]
MYAFDTIAITLSPTFVVIGVDSCGPTARPSYATGINIGFCALFLSLYSILRKQPSNLYVYFGRRLEKENSRYQDPFTLERFVPSAGWIVKAWEVTEDEILSIGGLDAVEYKNISQMKLAHVTGSPPNPSHFTILVRAIPKSTEESLTDTIRNFFTNYHGSSYLSHQIISRTGKFQKFMSNAKKVYKKFVRIRVTALDNKCRPSLYRCGLCGVVSNSFQFYHSDYNGKRTDLQHSDTRKRKECSAAFVFFKTRYAAVVASKVLQTSNPMQWVTGIAPEPCDVYWPNLWIPFGQLWIRRLATLLATIVFMFLFLIPVTFVQGLTQLDQLQQKFPFLNRIPNKAFVIQFVSGYLPSVILQVFLYSVPPMMMMFSTVEGPISRSGRKRSACCKILYFTIWNVFFVNVLSGSIISQLHIFSRPKDIPVHLAKAVPRQATFFITYVLTLGWASLSSEVLQTFSLSYNWMRKYIFRLKDDPNAVPSFPYHTEVPKVLLFGLIGFTCSILAPLIVPFLLVYFFLGYLVYRNQILNVYSSYYESGGRMWPIVHNTTVFSLLLMQIIALGVFGTKDAPVASGFTIPLLIFTLLFSEYCRHHFNPIFKNFSAQDFIEMDREDEQTGRMKDIHMQLLTAYCQLPPPTTNTEETYYDDSVAGDAHNQEQPIF